VLNGVHLQQKQQPFCGHFTAQPVLAGIRS